MNPFAHGWDEAKVDTVLSRGDPNELLYVPIVVSLDPPSCVWSFAICLRLATHADDRVRANALLSFGHLARTCGALDQTARPLIEAALTDPNDEVRFKANDAAHDINHFLGWNIPTLDD